MAGAGTGAEVAGDCRASAARNRFIIGQGSSVSSRSCQHGWRMGWDSNPRCSCPHASFQDWSLKPLGHPSVRPAVIRASASPA